MDHDIDENGRPPYCKVCHGVQGSSLASECPGARLSSSQVAGLYNHTLDYRDGEWVDLRSPAPAAAEPTPANPGGSFSATVEVEVDGGEEEPPPHVRTENRYIPIPIPVPVPIPIPVGGSSAVDNPIDAVESDDPDVDVSVNRR
jgi:hypothetical protein